MLVPLSLHGLYGSAVLLCPGGGPPSVGHGGFTLASSGGCAVDTIGFGVGLGVGFGVERGVGRAVGVGVLAGLGAGGGLAVGTAVGRAVGRAVGALVGRAVGVGVLAGLGAGVGLAVGRAVGRAVGALVAGADGRWLAVGPCVPAGTTFGVGEAAAPVGDGIGDPGGFNPGPSLGVATLVEPGAGGVTTATGPCPDPSDRCWSPTPPMPIAIVASTRFRAPRLRTRRAR